MGAIPRLHLILACGKYTSNSDQHLRFRIVFPDNFAGEHVSQVGMLTVPVEDSRAIRIQRQQARFRDRGGLFVPATKNPLIDILLSRTVSGESPPKPKHRDSVDSSHHDETLSPLHGKGPGKREGGTDSQSYIPEHDVNLPSTKKSKAAKAQKLNAQTVAGPSKVKNAATKPKARAKTKGKKKATVDDQPEENLPEPTSNKSIAKRRGKKPPQVREEGEDPEIIGVDPAPTKRIGKPSKVKHPDNKGYTATSADEPPVDKPRTKAPTALAKDKKRRHTVETDNESDTASFKKKVKSAKDTKPKPKTTQHGENREYSKVQDIWVKPAQLKVPPLHEEKPVVAESAKDAKRTYSNDEEDKEENNKVSESKRIKSEKPERANQNARGATKSITKKPSKQAHKGPPKDVLQRIRACCAVQYDYDSEPDPMDLLS